MKKDRYTTISDAGALRIGNEVWSIDIPNGFGDGDTIVEVETEISAYPKDFNDYNFLTAVHGTFNLYGYDCETTQVVATLSGRYGIYVKKYDLMDDMIDDDDYSRADLKAHIVFEKWN